MKPGHKYHVNPAPFVAIVANPRRGKLGRRPKKKRNPAKARRVRPAMFVIRGPKRSPAKKTVAMKHKKRRRHSAKRRNPAKLEHVLLLNPRRKKQRRAKRRVARKLFSSNPSHPMKKYRRRGKRRHAKNPTTRRGSRRRSGRRRSLRLRNPMPMIRDIFSSDILATTGGVLIGSVASNTVISKIVSGRSFDLPGVDYSMLASADPAVKQTFYSKNSWALGIYKLIVGAGAGLLVRRYSPRLGTAIIGGGMVAAVTTVLQSQGIVTPTGTLGTTMLGVGRNYPARGTGYLPGTSTRYTGPAQGFLTANNVPRPRGMGAAVGPRMVQHTQGQVEGAFIGAN